jgi:endonuclease/exonuclease/phosphatase (EEP) superfamily protein YafD
LSALEPQFRYRVAVPLSNTYGMHLYSKLPLTGSEVRYLIEPDIPSIRSRVQLPSGEWIQLYVVHPRPPVPTEAKDTKERDAEIILVGKESRMFKEGVIVAGDFNDVAWSENTELFQEVSGLLDPAAAVAFTIRFMPKSHFPLAT